MILSFYLLKKCNAAQYWCVHDDNIHSSEPTMSHFGTNVANIKAPAEGHRSAPFCSNVVPLDSQTLVHLDDFSFLYSHIVSHVSSVRRNMAPMSTVCAHDTRHNLHVYFIKLPFRHVMMQKFELSVL